MKFTVELRVAGKQLPAVMSEMRSWLDSHRIEPCAFRYSRVAPAGVRLDFTRESEAAAFAQSFGGSVRRTGALALADA